MKRRRGEGEFRRMGMKVWVRTFVPATLVS